MKSGFYMQNHELVITNFMHQLFFVAPKNRLSYCLSRAVKLIKSYLSNRKQRIKIKAAYSSWKEILFGVPWGSVLGPSLFNTFLCDLFWIMCETDFASQADDNTPYALGDSTDDIIKSLEDDSINLFKWFLDNRLKANSDKCHLSTSK